MRSKIIIAVAVVLIGIIAGLMFWLNFENKQSDRSFVAANPDYVIRVDNDTIPVGKTQKVTFWAEIKTDDYKGVKSVPLIKIEDGSIIGYLYDDGTHNDKIANDGIYTNQFELHSDIREWENYDIELVGLKGIKAEIMYTKPFTKEEWQEWNKIADEITAIESTYQYTGNSKTDDENLTKMIANLEEYLEAQIDKGVVRRYTISREYLNAMVILSSGMLAPSIFSSDPHIQSLSSSWDISNNVRKLGIQNTTTDRNDKQRIITLEPYRDTLSYEVFDNSANKVAKSLNNYEFTTDLDNEYVTIKELESISDYRIIILNTHGGIMGFGESAFTIAEPVTEKFEADYDDYIKNGIIFPLNDKKGVIVTYKFFKNKKFNHSLIYLGSCHLMNNINDNRLINTLVDCGAQTIIGFENTVYNLYNNKVCETLFNELSKKKWGEYNTTLEAVNEAINKHKKYKQKIGDISKLILCGNEGFRLSDNLDEYGELGDSDLFDYKVNNNFTLITYDSENTPFMNYNLKIEKNINSSEVMTSLIFNENINSASKNLHLDSGHYIFTITNLAREEQKIVWVMITSIPIVKNDKIDIYTDFNADQLIIDGGGVSATVKDVITQELIVDAIATAYDENGKEVYQTTTNANGQFLIYLDKGKYKIIIEHKTNEYSYDDYTFDVIIERSEIVDMMEPLLLHRTDEQEIKRVFIAQCDALNNRDIDAYMATIYPKMSEYDSTKKAAQNAFKLYYNKYDLEVELIDFKITSIDETKATIEYSIKTKAKIKTQYFRDNILKMRQGMIKYNGTWYMNEEVENLNIDYLD